MSLRTNKIKPSIRYLRRTMYTLSSYRQSLAVAQFWPNAASFCLSTWALIAAPLLPQGTEVLITAPMLPLAWTQYTAQQVSKEAFLIDRNRVNAEEDWLVTTLEPKSSTSKERFHLPNYHYTHSVCAPPSPNSKLGPLSAITGEYRLRERVPRARSEPCITSFHSTTRWRVEREWCC